MVWFIYVFIITCFRLFIILDKQLQLYTLINIITYGFPLVSSNSFASDILRHLNQRILVNILLFWKRVFTLILFKRHKYELLYANEWSQNMLFAKYVYCLADHVQGHICCIISFIFSEFPTNQHGDNKPYVISFQ